MSPCSMVYIEHKEHGTTNDDLMALEDMEIGLHPNSWNEAGKNQVNKLKPSRPHKEKLLLAQQELSGCSRTLCRVV